MPIGQQQTLSFQGQATHGGGACQISLTTDNPPKKDSTFKVIKTIEGGCPSLHPGNVGTDPFGYGADKFNFAIPDTVPPGNYSLAWTWFNYSGNREMYMNCAPVTVTPSTKRSSHSSKQISQRDSFDALPDIFKANIGNGCTTPPSGTLVAIPAANKGTNVQRIGTQPLVPPIGNCGDSSAPTQAGSASSAAAVQPSAQASQSQASPAQSTGAGSTNQCGSNGGAKCEPGMCCSAHGFCGTSQDYCGTGCQSAFGKCGAGNGSSGAAAPAPPSAQPSPQTSVQSPAAQPSAQNPPPNASGAPASPPASSSTGTASNNPVPGTTTGTCSTPGKSVCSPDGKSWGTCMANGKVIFQPVAPNTKCDPALGVEVPLKIKKRVARAKLQ